MGLLDKIKKEVQNKHPLIDEDFETKINYINAVAFFIAIDNIIDDNEKESFDEIINILDCEDVSEDLYGFLENPDSKEFENTFKFIVSKGYFITYLLEVFYLKGYEELNEFENEFIDVILDISEYLKDELNIIFSFTYAIKNTDNSEIKESILKILQNKKLFKNIEKFTNFHKLNKNTKNMFNIGYPELESEKEIIFKLLKLEEKKLKLERKLKKLNGQNQDIPILYRQYNIDYNSNKRKISKINKQINTIKLDQEVLNKLLKNNDWKLICK